MSLLALSFIAVGSSAPPAWASRVEQHLDELRAEMNATLSAYVAEVVVTESSVDGLQSFEFITFWRPRGRASATIFTHPPHLAGRAYLSIDDRTSRFIPSLRRWSAGPRFGTLLEGSLISLDIHEYKFDGVKVELTAQDRIGDRPCQDVRIERSPDQLRNVGGVPVRVVCLDLEHGRPLRISDFNRSGRLLQQYFFPRWSRTKLGAREVWLFRELHKHLPDAKRTISVEIRAVSLGDQPDSLFTPTGIEALMVPSTGHPSPGGD